MRQPTLHLLGVCAAVLLVVACTERSPLTGPPTVAGATAHRTILGSPASVHVVTRDSALATSQSASAVIGAFGGTLTLPGAGLAVVVPPFAVLSPTTFTVTAVAGSQVAYEFEPHGAQFVVPLVVTQDLTGTSAANWNLLLPPLSAGYFSSASDLNLAGGTALVSELLGTTSSVGTHTLTFPVFHFSGYLIATGNDSTGADSSSH